MSNKTTILVEVEARLSRPNQLAAALLLIGVARNYGWIFTEPQFHGVASKALGAIAALFLLLIIWNLVSSKLLSIFSVVVGWYVIEELQTALCSVMYLIEPWPVGVGQSMCSARIGFDLGAVGIFIVGLIAYKMVNKSRPRE